MEITNLHSEILDENRISLLRKIAGGLPFDFYMAGGTALSLQKGYRQSVDFDFFTPVDFNPEQLDVRLKELGHSHSVINLADGTCDVLLDGVQVSFFRYPYQMLKEVNTSPEYPGLQLASVADIACMKLVAIGQRGAKKDFYDLYQIMKDEKWTVHDLIEAMTEKYGTDRDFSYIGMGMSYFGDAETQILPTVYRKVDWNEIRRFFEKTSDHFMQELEKSMRFDLK